MAPQGVISFARFMELALYCPVYGFYEQERDRIGRRGDYYTSVSVGSLFGELLAFQFAEWLDELGMPNAERGTYGNTAPLQIVEGGAHDGRLAADILGWMRSHRPELFASLEYWILEPSPRRREWQTKTLEAFAPKVRWFTDFGSISTDPRGMVLNRQSPIVNRQSPSVRGVVFCNELLDAMPVHRLGWDARKRAWFEWGVGVSGEKFAWVQMPVAIEASAQSLRFRFQLAVCPFDLAAELLDVLPDGFTVEISPAALNWWQEAAGALECGKLLTFDYGLSADQFFTPEKGAGTLRAYHRHRLCADVLANVGEQDLTAHVNFTALQAVGKTAGLKTEELLTQGQLLTRIAKQTGEKRDVFGDWAPERVRQFKTLIHPEHLGRAFRVLIQSRGRFLPCCVRQG